MHAPDDNSAETGAQGARDRVILRGVRTHNLKGIDCDILHGSMTVVTGVSGSGKSSLAFDTLYAEGQRRYTESLSTYARQFLQRLARPPVDAVENIQPAVALRQKNEVFNARSTVGTITELDDFLQLLFTHAGQTTCPTCQVVVRRDTASSVVEDLARHPEGTRAVLVAEVDASVPELRGAILRGLIAEGYNRLYLDDAVVDMTEEDIERLLDRERLPVLVDRLVVRAEERMRMTEAVESAMSLGKGRVLVHFPRSEEPSRVYDQAFRCNGCAQDFVEPQPALFSFNSSLGACTTCSGFGRSMGVDFRKVIPDGRRTLEQGVVACFQTPQFQSWQKRLIQACMTQNVPLNLAFDKMAPEHQQWVKYGGKRWPGITGFFEDLKDDQYKTHVRVFLAKYRGYDICASCLGARLQPAARLVRFDGRTVADIRALRIEQAHDYFASLAIDQHTLARMGTVLEEIRHRLRYLMEVGLGYLTLDRQSRTLSGGEMQRIHLTASLGRALTDTLYVLDEPTAGLHARDSQRLLAVLRGLRDVGNTVVVVEHDPEIILGADHVLEIGPTGGEKGGQVVYAGTQAGFAQSGTLTASLLHRLVPPNAKPLGKVDGWVRIRGASENNLQHVDAAFPHERLTVVTGVSGSGKSTLMEDILVNGWRRLQGEGGVEAGACEALEGLEGFEDVVLMDQAALGRSSRSNPVSYTKAYDDIRKLFGQLPQSQLAGLTMSDFSFNTPGGRCEACQGTGVVTLEMHFMADVDVTCDQCDGKRFTRKVLGVPFRGRNIYEVLQLTVDEALEIFHDINPLVRKLSPLKAVGLGYVRLGQTTATLSGGEAQRLKLATYIAEGRRSEDTRPVLFVFDEPTVGLHTADVQVLLSALGQLVNLGHTVIAIEHNVEFIAQCDYVVDLGPEAGPEGGRVVAVGTPAELAACAASITGRYLARAADGEGRI